MSNQKAKFNISGVNMSKCLVGRNNIIGSPPFKDVKCYVCGVTTSKVGVDLDYEEHKIFCCMDHYNKSTGK